MDNSYFTTVNPYFAQQDQGLSPVFQNIAQQQQNQNMAIQQGQQMAQQAAQSGQQSGGMNPMMMAAMLRKKPGQADINAKDAQMGGLSTYNPFTQNSISQQYGTDPYSQTSRMLAAQERGM
jgi:aromatic ring-opening dioxygenase catalytic subunit (LigB family)